MNLPHFIIKQLSWNWVALLILYLLIQLFIFTSARQMRVFSDSSVFTTAAQAPLLSQSLWAGQRPPLTSLLYKAVRNHEKSIGWIQLSISVISWSTLAFAITKTVRSPEAKIIAAFAVLGFSLSSSISQWNNVLLSESLTLSSLALFVASWIFFFHTPNRLTTTAIIATAILLAASRDTNTYILLALSPAIFLTALTSKSKQRYLLLTIVFACVLIFAASTASANIGNRWVFPFYNVISQRILPHPDRLDFFTAQSLPINSSLLALTGKWASSNDYAYFNDPNLSEFRKWAAKQGKPAYIKYLLLHPAYSLLSPLSTINRDFTAYLLDHAAPGYTPLFPYSLITARIHSYLFILYAPVLIVAFVLASRISTIRHTPLFWIATTLLITSYLHYLVAWHGDAMETSRHALPAATQFRLSVLFISTLIINNKINKSTTLTVP